MFFGFTHEALNEYGKLIGKDITLAAEKELPSVEFFKEQIDNDRLTFLRFITGKQDRAFAAEMLFVYGKYHQEEDVLNVVGYMSGNVGPTPVTYIIVDDTHNGKGQKYICFNQNQFYYAGGVGYDVN